MRGFDESFERDDPAASAEVESLRAVALDSHRLERLPIDARVSGDIVLDEPLPVRRTPLGAKLLFALVLGGCVFVLTLSARTYWVDRVARASHPADAPRPPSVAAVAVVPPTQPGPTVAAVVPPPPTTPTPAPLPTPVAAPPPAVLAPVADPPKPTKATLKLAKKAHALRVDGKLVKGPSVEVACGPHLVAVGKQKARRVDAVCGRTVVVDAQKAVVVDDDETPPARTRSPRSPRLAAPAKRTSG